MELFILVVISMAVYSAIHLVRGTGLMDRRYTYFLVTFSLFSFALIAKYLTEGTGSYPVKVSDDARGYKWVTLHDLPSVSMFVISLLLVYILARRYKLRLIYCLIINLATWIVFRFAYYL